MSRLVCSPAQITPITFRQRGHLFRRTHALLEAPPTLLKGEPLFQPNSSPSMPLVARRVHHGLLSTPPLSRRTRLINNNRQPASRHAQTRHPIVIQTRARLTIVRTTYTPSHSIVRRARVHRSIVRSTRSPRDQTAFVSLKQAITLYPPSVSTSQ